ncbi:MAG: hypothetical protein U0350_47420 [Caldilineaceae bacterium]
MQNITSLKVKGQEGINRLVDLGKQQPAPVQTWGITAAAAVGGALVLAATAQGVLAILATLAAPPVALTVGAIGGGLAGWSYMQNHQAAQAQEPAAPVAETQAAPTEPAVAN